MDGSLPAFAGLAVSTRFRVTLFDNVIVTVIQWF